MDFRNHSNNYNIKGLSGNRLAFYGGKRTYTGAPKDFHAISGREVPTNEHPDPILILFADIYKDTLDSASADDKVPSIRQHNKLNGVSVCVFFLF